jgi:nucleotide-binding universal stress UspA family protein
MSVVVGYAPSVQGDAALRAGAREARRRKVDLVVASHAYYDADNHRTVADATVVGEALTAQEDGETPTFTVRSSDQEDVGDFLLEVAGEVSATLLVIGLRRKSRIGKLNLGATARKVVMDAPCPVLAVKAGGVSSS